MATLTGQVVGWSTRAPTPVLRLLDMDGIRTVPLEGDFALEVAAEATCVGRWEEGQHVPCPDQRVVQGWSQCLACTPLEDPACVFEPKCARDPSRCSCLSSFATVPHVVYIAWYGILPKVGITQAPRIAARIQEQGADGWFLAAEHDAEGAPLGRGAARLLEREIHLLHHIPEHRRTREVLAQATRPVPWEAMQRKAAALAGQLGRHYATDPTLHPMRDHAATVLPARPSWVDPAGPHRGTWIGGKGPFLFYEAEHHGGVLPVGRPPIAALKAPWLTGRVVTVR